MVKLDRRTAEYILATGAAIDFLLEGKFANPIARAVKAAARRAIPAVGMAAGRAGISVAGTALGVGRLLMANPYILGGTAIYVGIKERDKIKALLEQGYDIVEERLPTPSLPPSPGIPGVEEIITSGMIPQFIPGPIPTPVRMRATRRKASPFNKAVSAGMKAVKNSTSYGKRGVIKPAKKAFALVTKLASAKKKKKKAPKSGIRRRIWNAMKGLR
jgi:hypothetical protein